MAQNNTMAPETERFLKKNLPAWITFANFALLLSFVWYQAQWQQGVDNRLEKLDEHSKDKNVHMPYIEQAREFVPRTELQIKMDMMQKTLEEIKDDIKNLEKK